jgi:cytochrome c biogenesis protein CcmG/thiol:disulfide interchange protein DsbE
MLALMACSSSPQAAGAGVKPEKNRKAAPEFTLKDAAGRAVHLSDYRGKVVLLNFWATWCGPCRIEIPWFKDFEQQYKDRGFAVLGVAMDDDGWEAVKPYIERMRLNYRVLLGDAMVSESYGGVDSLPTTFVIDREGRVASVHIGLVGKEAYQNDIVALLESSERVQNSGGGNAAVAVSMGAK